MAVGDEKISGLPLAGALNGSEPLAIVQEGVTVSTTTQEVANLPPSESYTLGSNTGIGGVAGTTYTFNALNDGEVESMTITGGIVTGIVTKVVI